MSTTQDLQSALDAVYAKYTALRLDSSTQDFDDFAALFANDCEVYLRSMREHKTPARSHAEIVEHLQDILKDQFLSKYRVVSQGFDEGSRRVYTELANDYNIHGKVLPSFAETCIATFDSDGRIKTFKLYSCRSDLVFLIQKATGQGPYSQEYLDQ